MPRVKRAKSARKKKKKVLKLTKGYRWGRKSKYRLAKDALAHAWSHAFKHRKAKKRTFRGLWQTQINAASREKGISYSKFMNLLKKNKIEINRKVLAEIGQKHPAIFEKIVEKVALKKQTKKTA